MERPGTILIKSSEDVKNSRARVRHRSRGQSVLSTGHPTKGKKPLHQMNTAPLRIAWWQKKHSSTVAPSFDLFPKSISAVGTRDMFCGIVWAEGREWAKCEEGRKKMSDLFLSFVSSPLSLSLSTQQTTTTSSSSYSHLFSFPARD